MKKKKGESVVFLAMRNGGNIDGGIRRAIKKDIGGNPHIRPIHSRHLFSKARTLSSVIEGNKNIGKVYVIKDEMPLGAIEVASKTDIPFGVLFKSPKDGWILLQTVQETIKQNGDYIDTVA